MTTGAAGRSRTATRSSTAKRPVTKVNDRPRPLPLSDG